MKLKATIPNKFLILTAFCILSLSAAAQFRKPLSPSRDRATMNDAKFNIGILGGVNLTSWLHFDGPSSGGMWGNYSQVILEKDGKLFDSGSLGYFGGLSVEYMISQKFSIGLNAVYARHNFRLEHSNDRYPLGWNTPHNSIHYAERKDYFSAKYHSIEAYIPFTYYLILQSMKNVKPYGFVAPRFSYVINQLPLNLGTASQMTSGNEILAYNPPFQILHTQQIHSDDNKSVGFSKDTYRLFNVGATLGLGSQFRINTSSYYFLVKFDLSANFNALSTYTRADEIIHQHKLRFSTDANATLTFQLPVKKRLKGACVKWGKYN